ncbi:nitroreductase family protein [Naumannella halotolerans]|uniref:nitroreductase family protein n=1 Tax=Naumannella halotolerans TaxID=993414 RepID=UPI00370D645A
MQFSEVVQRRRMIRRFDPRPVADDQLSAVLEAGLRAPSAGFSQGVSLLALTGGQVDRFWQVSAGERRSGWLDDMRQAPVIITVWTSELSYRRRYAEPDKGRRVDAVWEVPWWWVDAGAVIENLLLAAADDDLAAALFGVRGIERVRAAFGVPDEQASAGAIALGHRAPDETPRGSATRRARRTDAIRIDHW